MTNIRPTRAGTRREFCAAAAGLATGGGTAVLRAAINSNRTGQVRRPGWGVLYWMPYDNDMSSLADPIVDMLWKAASPGGVAVAIQSDQEGAKRMRRRSIIDGRIREYRVDAEDSSNPNVFRNYLDWAARDIAVEHWAVVVLGHGGRVGEISPDNHSASPGAARTWMAVDQFTDAVRRFGDIQGRSVELVYFQNCFKATLETVYAARGSAQCVMASQMLVGAPNYYYAGFLGRLRQDPSLSAGAAGRALIAAERADMYHSLTLVNASVAHLLPQFLDPLIDALLESECFERSATPPRSFRYGGENYCDALELFRYLVERSNRGQAELAAFTKYVTSELILEHLEGGDLYSTEERERYARVHGLNVLSPASVVDLKRARGVPLYSVVRMAELYSRFAGCRGF